MGSAVLRGVGYACCMLIGPLIGGCSTAGYVPKRPVSQTTSFGRVTPTLVERRVPRDSEITFETEFAEGTRLHGAYREKVPAPPPPNRWLRPQPSTEPASRKRCARHAIERVTLDGEPDYVGAPLDVSGKRRLSFPLGTENHVTLDLEIDGKRECVSVDVNWPRGWNRDDTWQYLAGLDLAFNVAGNSGAPGASGLHLNVFRWFNDWRIGVGVGVMSESCDDDLCGHGEAGLLLPFGVEADWFLAGGSGPSTARDGSMLSMLYGAGFRAVAYAPMPAVEPAGGLMLSPQLTLRAVISWPPEGPSALPAGITFDESIFVGPAVVPETGATALLLGFSLGVGWSQ